MSSKVPSPVLEIPGSWQRREVQIEDSNGRRFAAHVGLGSNKFAFVLDDKGHDVVRVKETRDGRTRFALADGVTQTMFPREAAQVATDQGLAALTTGASLLDAYKAAARGLDDYRFANKESFHERVLRMAEAGNEFAKHDLKKNSIAATTLDLGHSNANFLEAGILGDSSLFVYSPVERELRAFDLAKRPQVQYDVRGSYHGDPLRVQLSLVRGEIYFFASDGLEEKGLAEALHGVANAEDFVDKMIVLLRKRVIDDDVSFVGGVQD